VSLRWRRACAALLASALGLGVAGSAEASRRWSSPTDRPREKDVLDVELVRPLVERGLMEHAPRELAGVAVDPATGDLFVGTRDGVLRALAADGVVLWERTLSAKLTAAPLFFEDSLYVGASDGKLHALDRIDGTERWSAKLGGELSSAPVRRGEQLFVGTDQGTIHALVAATGASAWVYRRDPVSDMTIQGGPGVAVDDARVYAGFADGVFVALDPTNGRRLWELPVGAPGKRFRDADATPVVDGGLVFMTGFVDGVVGVEAATGKLRWRKEAAGAHALGLGKGKLLVAGQGFVEARRPSDGASLWRVKLSENATAAAPRTALKLALVSTTRGLLVLDEETGEPLRRFDPGAGFGAPPALDRGRAWLLSDKGTLYRLRLVGVGSAP